MTLSQSKRGRPQKITAGLSKHLVWQAQENPTMYDLYCSAKLPGQCRNQCDEIRTTHGVEKKPLLTKKHKQDRLSYANTDIDKLETFWQKVVECDQTRAFTGER